MVGSPWVGFGFAKNLTSVARVVEAPDPRAFAAARAAGLALGWKASRVQTVLGECLAVLLAWHGGQLADLTGQIVDTFDIELAACQAIPPTRAGPGNTCARCDSACGRMSEVSARQARETPRLREEVMVTTGVNGGGQRPDVARWLWYAVSGRLPMSYRKWVLYDLTCPSWPLRHLARLLVPLVPVAGVLVAVLPGPVAIRATGVAIGSVVGLLYTFPFLEDSTDRRATKFGYPSGTAREVREQRARQKRAGQQSELHARDEPPPTPDQGNGHRPGLDQRGTEPFRPPFRHRRPSDPRRS